MTTDRQPPRWAESDSEIPSALRDWLGRERAAGPSDDQLRDLAARVEAKLSADPNAGSEGSGASEAGPTFNRIARVAGTVIAIGVTIAVGGAFYRTLSPSSPRDVRSAGAGFAGERLSPVVIASAAPSTEPTIPSPPVPSPGPAPLAEQGPAPTPAIRPQSAPARPARGSVQPQPLSDPEAELELLRRARGQLANTPQRALDTTAQHQASFRNGVFAQEREAIAIEALVRLGKQAQAQRRANAFYARYPNSAYTRRLEAIAPRH